MIEAYRHMVAVIENAIQVSPLLIAALVVVEVLVVALSVFLLVRYAKFTGYMVRNARRNVLRSFLTMLGVIIGVALVNAFQAGRDGGTMEPPIEVEVPQ